MAMATVNQGWWYFHQAFCREIRVAWRKPAVHWLVWCFPLLLFVLIGSNFSEGTLQDLPVSVVDNDHSPLSRQLIRQLNAAPHARLSQHDGGLSEAQQRLQQAQDYGLLYIPLHFEADLLAGKQPRVTFYYNALFYGAGLYSTQDFSGLVAELNSQYRTVLASSTGHRLPAMPQVSLLYDSLFNASGSYVYYQQFAATIHLLQLFVITCMIYTLARSRPLIYAQRFGLALLGKLAPYTLCYTTLLMAELALMVWIFDARVVGNPLYMLSIGFFYTIAAQSIGVLLFAFTGNAITAYTLVGMMVGIALTFSGQVIPELAMSPPARIISMLEPLTHALHAMFDLFLREVPSQPVFSVCALLLVYPLVAAFLVRRRLYLRLEKQAVVK